MAELVRKAAYGTMWRIIGWGTAVVLLAAPFVAMQLNAAGVNWTAGDFVFAAVIFGTIGGLLELAVWKIKSGWYRAGVALALLGYLLTIWVNLAVGIVGTEHNPSNQLFFAALLIGIVGAFISRFRSSGMSWAMIGTAAGIAVAFVIAKAARSDEPNVSHWAELAGTSIFTAILLASAWLFRRAAADHSSSSS